VFRIEIKNAVDTVTRIIRKYMLLMPHPKIIMRKIFVVHFVCTSDYFSLNSYCWLRSQQIRTSSTLHIYKKHSENKQNIK